MIPTLDGGLVEVNQLVDVFVLIRILWQSIYKTCIIWAKWSLKQYLIWR